MRRGRLSAPKKNNLRNYMVEVSTDDIVEIVSHAPDRRLSSRELRQAAKYLGLSQEALGIAWGVVGHEFKRTRLSVNGYMCGRVPVSIELSLATRILLARRLKQNGNANKVPLYLAAA